MSERSDHQTGSVHAASEATSPGNENALEFASPANIEYEPHITVDVLQGKEKGMRKLAVDQAQPVCSSVYAHNFD